MDAIWSHTWIPLQKITLISARLVKGDQYGIERKVSKKDNDEGVRTTMYGDSHSLDYIALHKYLAKVQERCDECRLVLVCHIDSYILDNITR
jgi:hypothetical protein